MASRNQTVGRTGSDGPTRSGIPHPTGLAAPRRRLGKSPRCQTARLGLDCSSEAPVIARFGGNDDRWKTLEGPVECVGCAFVGRCDTWAMVGANPPDARWAALTTPRGGHPQVSYGGRSKSATQAPAQSGPQAWAYGLCRDVGGGRVSTDLDLTPSVGDRNFGTLPPPLANGVHH